MPGLVSLSETSDDDDDGMPPLDNRPIHPWLNANAVRPSRKEPPQSPTVNAGVAASLGATQVGTEWFGDYSPRSCPQASPSYDVTAGYFSLLSAGSREPSALHTDSAGLVSLSEATDDDMPGLVSSSETSDDDDDGMHPLYPHPIHPRLNRIVFNCNYLDDYSFDDESGPVPSSRPMLSVVDDPRPVATILREPPDDDGAAGASSVLLAGSSGSSTEAPFVHVPVTVVPGAPTLLPDSAFTLKRFFIVAGPGHGWLLSACGREYHLPRGAGGRLTLSGEIVVDQSGSVSFDIGFPVGAG